MKKQWKHNYNEGESINS